MPDPAVYFPVEGRDARSLASCCGVNRNWKSTARPLLYSRWTYHGEKHSIKSLWKFLCTVIRGDSIAALVQSVDARNWSFPSKTPHPDFDVLQEELFLVEQAFRAAGVEGMDKCVMGDVRQGDRKPFMALLFTRLPNLRTMSAHLPHYDAFLGSVPQDALTNQTERPTMQAFQQLEELSLVSERERPYWESSGRSDTRYSLELVCYAAVFSLPRLRRLSLFDLDVEDALHHCGPRPRTSSIQHLTLVNKTLLGGRRDDPRAPFRLKDTLPTSLKSLTFYGTNGLVFDMELEDQFREILRGGGFPNLECVIFEDVSEFVHCYTPPYVKRPNQAVKALCYEARVNFRERKIRNFPQGGKQQPWRVEITTEDEYDPKEDVSDTKTDVTSQDGGDINSESGSLEFDSEDLDELGFFEDSELELDSDDNSESLDSGE
ncbi:uncharacterized protein PAC_16382 [Phialocephala subalpina]|uniref:Uncharacterized protein n=1 Tax=Phialocephala subalpina TaxID=576137 RepID=A0A1L7XN45_9HELO|nr:uncharacterized protein PAC_16382 [Phialocephala subalpina]